MLLPLFYNIPILEGKDKEKAFAFLPNRYIFLCASASSA